MATSDTAKFSSSLRTIREVARLPAKEVNADPASIRTVAERLLDTPPETPEYWPTVLQFLRFASTGLSQNLRLSRPILLQNVEMTGVGRVTNPGATIELDGGKFENTTFEGNIIIFTANPTRFKNVRFINCILIFPILDRPPDWMKKTARQFLASGFASISDRKSVV